MKEKAMISTFLVLALFLALVPIALASTTWYVNGVSGNDSNNCMSPTTPCKTIRHAISLAASGDSLRVAAATYTENLTIGISLNVIGAGARTTIIDGQQAGRVITISSASARIILSNITIRNGNGHVQGGGIYNIGTLTVDYATISGNGSQAGQGGGIYNTGTLTVNHSTISGNGAASIHGGYGGGILNSGRLTINASLISGNGVGGESALRPVVSGGGILNTSSGSVTINNSTLYGNAAGCGNILQHCGGSEGGGISNGGLVAINNSTLYGNSAWENLQNFLPQGGGIYNLGSVYVQNSILANNTVRKNGVTAPSNCHGSGTSNGYNLSSDNTCNFNNIGDLNHTDPMLGTLGNYGGPTQTIPLLAGSLAIDAGDPSGCTDGAGHLLKTDQRGFPRPDKNDASGCDMGAYESQN